MPPKSIKKIINSFGRKLFSRMNKLDDISFGQTLNKKRCILKSVSTIRTDETIRKRKSEDFQDINFQFSSHRSTHYKGNVANFQKIKPTDSVSEIKCCCEEFDTIDNMDSISVCSVSSDSACDVISTSSCDDLDCHFRPSKKRIPKFDGSVEKFIEIHSHTFRKSENGVVNFAYRNSIIEEPDYETLNSRDPNYETIEPKFKVTSAPSYDFVEPNYDILITKSDYNIAEPNYENVKMNVTFFEVPKQFKDEPGSNLMPNSDSLDEIPCQFDCPFKKIRDIVRSNKTYDEVIESLKLLHSNGICSGFHGVRSISQRNLKCMEKNPFSNMASYSDVAENEMNHLFENMDEYENQLNHDIERTTAVKH